MKLKIVILTTIILPCVLLFADMAHAQFWRNWFQKEQQAEEIPMAEKAATAKAQDPQQGFAENEIQENIEADSFTDMAPQAVGRMDESAEQAARPESDLYTAAETISPMLTEIDAKDQEEALRRTQEQIDQIKKMQEMNNIQRSLDSIRRINEMNQQHRRIDEINRLNRMQRNLDELRRMEETKK
jgi:hypothetical protein